MLQLPAAFEEKMKNLLGSEWEPFLHCYANDRYHALRFNPGKVKKDEEQVLLESLSAAQEKDFTPVPWAEHGYYYDAECRPGRHPWHECGLYYIQEPSAMSAAALLAPQPGMRILDLCAAPGGKSTQLSAYLGNEGILVSNEINAGRSRILAQNVERLGIRNCIVTNEDSFKLADRFPAYFHGILVDAPCSGEGMFRKNDEATEEWSPENVEICAKRQEEILDNAARMLMPGGKLVYSTCTFSPEENEMQISSFLRRHPEFSVSEVQAPWFDPARPEWLNEEMRSDLPLCNAIRHTFRLWPHKLHGEGHYAAVLMKEGSLPCMTLQIQDAKTAVSEKKSRYVKEKNTKEKNTKEKNAKGKNQRNAGKGDGSTEAQKKLLLSAFADEALTESLKTFLFEGQTISFGDQLYRLPDDSPSLEGLHIQRAGLQIGEFKKNRFEPSHALALAMSVPEAAHAIQLSLHDPRVNAYFRGETFNLSAEDFTDGILPGKGWVLVTIEGYSAGWGKLAGTMLKNHYPKGLRFDFGN